MVLTDRLMTTPTLTRPHFAATGSSLYPIIVAVITLVVGTLFLSETKDRDIRSYEHT